MALNSLGVHFHAKNHIMGFHVPKQLADWSNLKHALEATYTGLKVSLQWKGGGGSYSARTLTHAYVYVCVCVEANKMHTSLV